MKEKKHRSRGGRRASLLEALGCLGRPRDAPGIGEHAMRLAGGLGAKLFVVGVVDTYGAFRPRAGYARAVSELEGECAATVREVGRLADESGVKHEARLARILADGSPPARGRPRGGAAARDAPCWSSSA